MILINVLFCSLFKYSSICISTKYTQIYPNTFSSKIKSIWARTPIVMSGNYKVISLRPPRSSNKYISLRYYAKPEIFFTNIQHLQYYAQICYTFKYNNWKVRQIYNFLHKLIFFHIAFAYHWLHILEGILDTWLCTHLQLNDDLHILQQI